jgi:hypothetical protein
MPYDIEFFAAYRNELANPPVRAAHDEMFSAFARLCGDRLDVLDLGCGTCEFHRYDRCHRRYHGVDLLYEEPGMPVARADFKVMPIPCPFRPTAFVSLFSTELILPVEERYALYGRLFTELPTIRAAMVAGFYYAKFPDELSVVESHGLRSYQTIEPARDVRSPHFREFRCYLQVPSHIFGPDVIEVWKFLTKVTGWAM